MCYEELSKEQQEAIDRWMEVKRNVLNDLLHVQNAGVVWAAMEAERCEKEIARITVTIGDLDEATHSQAIARAKDRLQEFKTRLQSVTDQAVTGKIIVSYLRSELADCNG